MTRLTIASDELFRTVHPQHVQGGVIAARAFVPRPATKKDKGDEGQLSVDEGKKSSVQESVQRRIDLGRQCVGVAVVTVGEVDAHGLEANENALEDNPAHALIDFTASIADDSEGIASALAGLAGKRGLRLP